MKFSLLNSLNDLVKEKIDIKDILQVSAITGEGVNNLIETIISHIPSPAINKNYPSFVSGIIFDLSYDNYQGVLLATYINKNTIKIKDRLIINTLNNSYNIIVSKIFKNTPF